MMVAPAILGAVLLAILVNVLYHVWIYPYYLSPLRGLPGPKDNHFIFGQCPKYLNVSWIPLLFMEWSQNWPEAPFIRYLGIGNRETLLANNIDAYREVLQTKNNLFIKPPITRRTANGVIGDGLPFAEGLMHRQRKQILNKPFAVSRLKTFIPTMQAKAKQLVNLLAVQRNDQGVAQVETSIWKATLDIIGIKNLGVDLNHLGSGKSPLFGLFGQTMKQSALGYIIHFFNAYIPLRHLIPISVNNDFVQSCDAVRAFLFGFVKDRRIAMKAGAIFKDAADSLQCMIEQGEENWSDSDIVEYLVNLMILGHDTTACTIVWAVHMLAVHVNHQHRLREEIQNLLRKTSAPTFDQIERLKFLDNFVQEVLRIFCPVAYIPRQAICDVDICGVVLPKGTTIELCPALMNQHPLIWGKDALNFNPDRWANLEGASASNFAFESFHNGPRVCIGKQLSLTEIKVMLIELISRFHIEPVGEVGKTEFASPSFTLQPKEKLRVRMTEIGSNEY